ncbi:MAG: hypothetical protein L0H25_01765 [Micrococcales bacterium]|nr:hypothetical protein [Micrococcales bacterium]
MVTGRPYSAGAGGPAIHFDANSGEVEEQLRAIHSGLPCMARVTIIASDHPDEHRELTEALIEVGEALVVTRLPTLTATAKGWQYRVPGQPTGMIPPMAGADDLQSRQTLNQAPFWLVGRGEGAGGAPVGMFESADEHRALMATRAEEKSQAQRQNQVQSRRTELENDRTGFVNPYNFVPLGNGPRRGEPAGQLALDAGRFSGRFTAIFTAVTDLALSGGGTGSADDPYAPHVLADGRRVVSGSSIAGAIRAFHEAITDSCLRVIDADFTPVHRDPAVAPEPERQRMAVVVSRDEVVLCRPWTHGAVSYPAIWVQARIFPAGHSFSADQRYHFDPSPASLAVRHARLELTGDDRPRLCTDRDCAKAHWRTIVSTPLGSRVREPRGTKEHPYHLPFAAEDAATAEPQVLGPQVLEDYWRAAEDSRDVVTRRRGDLPHLQVDGIGNRQEVGQTLTAGEVVWAEVDPATLRVRKVSRAVLWRTAGKHSVASRVGEYRPCADPDHLCPSCRLFGMAEERTTTGGADAGRARVAAYQGHVRASIATVSDVSDAVTMLAEMGSPSPGAGQFYLENSMWAGKQAPKGQRPLREWGSRADNPTPRQIRGRKRYWVSGIEATRHLPGPNPNAQMTSHHQLVPAGATLTATITFDNVTVEQLGGLLVSVNPDLLRHESVWRSVSGSLPLGLRSYVGSHQLGLHLGKGKGLGLGNVTATIAEQSLVAEDARRYTGAREGSAPPTVESCLREFTARGLASTLPQVVALSALDWVPSNLLKYPPDDTPQRDFRFDFWKKSSGAAGRTQGAPNALVILPDASQDDPRVPRPWLEDERR